MDGFDILNLNSLRIVSWFSIKKKFIKYLCEYPPTHIFILTIYVFNLIIEITLKKI